MKIAHVYQDLAAIAAAAGDSIDGDETNNSLDGTTGDDTITGLAGNDTIFGMAGDDFIDGGEGDDELTGGGGDDDLRGGAGNDILIDKSAGDDRLHGYTGDDTIIVSRQRTVNSDLIRIDANDGADDVTYTGHKSNHTEVRIDAGAGADSVTVSLAYDVLAQGRSGADNLTVDTTHHGHVKAGGDADVVSLSGSSGSIIGANLGVGDDRVTLDLRNGVDVRLGLGAGADTVVFGQGDAGDPITRVAIRDFDGHEGDKLVLRDYLLAMTDWNGTDDVWGNYLRIGRVAGHLTLKIDVDGGGDHYQTLVYLNGGELGDLTRHDVDVTSSADAFVI